MRLSIALFILIVTIVGGISGLRAEEAHNSPPELRLSLHDAIQAAVVSPQPI